MNIVSLLGATRLKKSADLEDFTYVDLTRFMQPGEAVTFTLCYTATATVTENGELLCTYYDAEKGMYQNIEAPLEEVTAQIMKQKRFYNFRMLNPFMLWRMAKSKKKLDSFKSRYMKSARKP
jgi:hypothetical protein